MFLAPSYPTIDFSEINDAADLVSVLNFAQSPMSLPENPTEEEFAKAEPYLIQLAIEQQIDPYAFAARERGEPIGNIIEPINMQYVKRVAPGRYQGGFSHDGQAYKFTIKPVGNEFEVVYAPVLKK